LLYFCFEAAYLICLLLPQGQHPFHLLPDFRHLAKAAQKRLPVKTVTK
jgi:hypothetical protein